MNRKPFLTAIIFACCYLYWLPLCLSQKINIAQQYSSDNTLLPSNTIYKIVCDTNNVLWIATDKGMVRYDNNKFTVYDLANQLPETDIVNLYYSPKNNKIWPLGSAGYLLTVDINTGKVENYQVPDKKNSTLLSAYENKDTIVFLSYHTAGKLSNSKWREEKLSEKVYTDFLANNPCQLSNLNYANYTKVKQPVVALKIQRFGKYNTLIAGLQVYFLHQHELYELLPTIPAWNDVSDRIIDFEVAGQDLYIALEGKDGGIYKAENYFRKGYASPFLRISEPGRATSITKDKYGNIWYSIIGKGLFLLHHSLLPFQITPLPALNVFYNTPAGFLKAVNDSLVIITKEENQYQLVRNNSGASANYTLSESLKEKQQYHYIFANRKEMDGRSMSFPKDISHDGHIWFGQNSMVAYSSDFSKREVLLNISDKFLFRSGDALGSAIVFYASDRHIYKYTTNNKELKQLDEAEKITLVNDIYFYKPDSIIFCTQKGVFLTDSLVKKIKQVSNQSYRKIIFHKAKFYLVNDKELAVYTPGTDSVVSTLLYTKYMLPQFSITDMDASDNMLHLLTNKGYIAVKDSSMPSIHPPLFTIRQVNTTDTFFYQLPENLQFTYRQAKSLEFIIQFYDPAHTAYPAYYSFAKKGEPENWKPFTDNSFIITNSAPGDYILRIKTTLPEYGKENSMAVQVYIKPAYWQTAWFSYISVLFAILIIIFISWKLTRRHSKKKIDELLLAQHISGLENKALLNQINPHFLFNALNTVQDYLVEKDTHNGIKYLQQLAALQRNILQFHRTPLITVNEEKSFLEKYFFIQQQRYSGRFSYEVVAAPETLRCKLTPMLLQPIAENAIEHAFAADQADALIKVSFYRDENNLTIRIEDNGPKTLVDFVPFKKDHSLFIINERLGYFNKRNEKNRDHVKVTCKPTGGVVFIITIPVIQ